MSASSGFTALSWNEILLMDLLFLGFLLTNASCMLSLVRTQLIQPLISTDFIHLLQCTRASQHPPLPTNIPGMAFHVLFGFTVTKVVFPQVTYRSYLYAEWIFFLSVIQRLQKRTIAPPRTFFGLLFGEYLTSLSRWNTYLLGLLYCRARGWCISSLPPLAQSGIVEREQKSRKNFWLATESGKILRHL